MTKITIDLPDMVFDSVYELAEQHEMSVEAFVMRAVAEKLVALTTGDLSEQANQPDRSKFGAALDQVADVEPDDHDKL